MEKEKEKDKKKREDPLEEKHEGFSGWLIKVFQPLDDLLGPSKDKYKPACIEDKEIFLDCVLKSDCYKETENFLYCVQDGVSKDCKALRYNYFMCKRSLMFWYKAFTTDDPRRI